MKYMTCNTCKNIVYTNRTGICFNCQRGFTGTEGEDKYDDEKEKEFLKHFGSILLASIERIKNNGS